MPDLAALSNDIKGMPDQALQSELSHPTGLVPSYLVLAEAQRRQLMRQASQKEQGQQSSTVYQDVIRNMMAKQPSPGPPAPAGMTPPSSSPPQPGATPPQNFSPPKTMAEGGSVDDEDSGDSEDSGNGGDLVQKLGQAIYRMEGSQPGSLATRNNNPGNLRGSSGEYAVFPDMDTGWQALHHQIQKNVDRGLTLKEFFAGKPGVYAGYAPAADNNQPLHYAANVADWTGIDPNTPLSSQIAGKSAPPASADTADATPLASNPFMGALTPPAAGLAAAANQAATSQQSAPDQAVSVPQPAPGIATPAATPPHRPIDDEIARLDAQIGQQQDQLARPARNNTQNLQESIRAILPALGYSPDALQNMEQRAYSSKATIQALQQDALQRYHKRDPWTYLSNLAAGMADSKSVLLPEMFAHGAAFAANAQDEAREKALSDWDALNKESAAIDNNIGSLHERLSTAVGGLLERQTTANAVDQQRRLAEIERLQKNRQDLMLKGQPMPATGEDALIAVSKGYDPRALTQEQAADVLKTKASSKTAVNTLQLAAKALNLPADSSQWTAAQAQQARDWMQQKPEEALDITPYSGFTSTGIPFVDGTNFLGKDKTAAMKAAAKTGVAFLGKDQAFDLNQIEIARTNQQDLANKILQYLPKDATGRFLGGALKNKLSAYFQTNPVLAASFKDYVGPAIQQLRAVAGSKGLRINQTEIDRVFKNDIPAVDDTAETALQKLNDVGRFLFNTERMLLPPRVGLMHPDENGTLRKVTKLHPDGSFEGTEAQQ